MEDASVDVLRLLMEKLPLQAKLTTLRSVNQNCKAIAEELCSKQRTLTLKLGTGGHFEEIVDRLESSPTQLINVISGGPGGSPGGGGEFDDTITAQELTRAAATTLTTYLPRLETLAVVVDDLKERAVEPLFKYLPKLFAAYQSTLTTLQLVFNVEEHLFLRAFPLIISSVVGSLRSLRQLAITDHTGTVHLPLFDLSHQLRVSLDTVDISAPATSPLELFRQWIDCLEGRTRIPHLMRINFQSSRKTAASEEEFREFAVAAPGVGGHFVSFPPVAIGGDPEAFFEEYVASLPNVRSVSLDVGQVVAFGEALGRLALSRLGASLAVLNLSTSEPLPMMPFNYEGIFGGIPPVLPALKQLQLITRKTLALPNDANDAHAQFEHARFEELQLQRVAPNVQDVTLQISASRCEACGWSLKVPSPPPPENAAVIPLLPLSPSPRRHLRQTELTTEDDEPKLERCALRLAEIFSQAKPKKMKVRFLVCEGYFPIIFSADFTGEQVSVRRFGPII